jgi:hypothetical protein
MDYNIRKVLQNNDEWRENQQRLRHIPVPEIRSECESLESLVSFRGCEADSEDGSEGEDEYLEFLRDQSMTEEEADQYTTSLDVGKNVDGGTDVDKKVASFDGGTDVDKKVAAKPTKQDSDEYTTLDAAFKKIVGEKKGDKEGARNENRSSKYREEERKEESDHEATYETTIDLTQEESSSHSSELFLFQIMKLKIVSEFLLFNPLSDLTETVTVTFFESLSEITLTESSDMMVVDTEQEDDTQGENSSFLGANVSSETESSFLSGTESESGLDLSSDFVACSESTGCQLEADSD